jgi:antitoxin (DNA-binding transcriptional repressor) of toxin-antitoxin stability system
MRFVSVREFRNGMASVRKALKKEHEIVVTANGKPFALLADVDEDSFEGRLETLRRARFHAALDRMQAQAKARGLDRMTMEEIDAVIARVRRERRAAR